MSSDYRGVCVIKYIVLYTATGKHGNRRNCDYFCYLQITHSPPRNGKRKRKILDDCYRNYVERCWDKIFMRA